MDLFAIWQQIRSSDGISSTDLANSKQNPGEIDFRKNHFTSSVFDGLAKANQNNTIIKVLVAYTTAAKNQEGGTSQMNALINNAKTSANVSYSNSNIPIELEIAYTVEVNYTESSSTNSVVPEWCEELGNIDRPVLLSDFQGTTDQYMNEIHDLRGLYGADIAVLITTPIIFEGGQAFEVGVTELPSSASKAFCYVNRVDADLPEHWSFTHEIGHLQGARHAKGGKAYEDDCDDPFANGHGYV